MIRFLLIWGVISVSGELCGWTNMGWYLATFPFWGPPTFLFALWLLAKIGYRALWLLNRLLTILFPKGGAV